MRNSVNPLSLHHPVQFISPPPFRQQQAPCVRQPGTKKGEQKQRERGMERQEERRMGAYIRTVSSDIFAFSRESHYEYQYGPRERKHSFLSFSLGYSCTKEIYSSQSNGQSVRLCMAVWTVQPLLHIFPLPPSLCLIAVKNTLRQVQLWQTLQYGNQFGLNACKELDTNNYQPTLYISQCVSRRVPSSSSSSSGAQRYLVKGMQIYPLPSSPSPICKHR